VPQALLSFAVGRKAPLEQLGDVQRVIGDVEKALGEDGRVLVRYSGTEAKARVLVEGPDEKAINAHANRIKDALVKALAV
jgi:phosphoglucosamine mutase